LNTNRRWYNKKLKIGRKSYLVKHYKTNACNDCKLRSACTNNNERVNTNPEYYRQRQQIIEYQFGTLKRHRHFDYTLMKGKQKVLGEVYLVFTAYNLGRSLSIIGFSGLMERIKAVLLHFFHNSGLSATMNLLRKKINQSTIRHSD
jgi:DDE family transposase